MSRNNSFVHGVFLQRRDPRLDMERALNLLGEGGRKYFLTPEVTTTPIQPEVGEPARSGVHNNPSWNNGLGTLGGS